MTTIPPFPSCPNDLTEFLTDLRPELLRYCRSLTNREWEAEDLVQETIVKVLKRSSQSSGIAFNKLYMFRTARNLWIDRCRSSRRHVSVSFDDLGPAIAPAAQTDTDFLITRDLLEELMYRLTPKPFVIVLLCDVFGLTCKEAGRCINMAEGTIQVALSRARKRLRLLALRDPDEPAEGLVHAKTDQGGSIMRLLEAVTAAFRRHEPRLIYEAYLGLFENGCRMAEIRSREGRFFFTFYDPDGNVLMVSE